VIIANLDDGKSEKFDIRKVSERTRFNSLGRDSFFCRKLRGLWLQIENHSTTIPLPKNFRQIYFCCDLLFSQRNGEDIVKGEKVTIHADEISVSVVSYYGSSPRMTRIDVEKIGKMRFLPEKGE
jgi:hypothetical protein